MFFNVKRHFAVWFSIVTMSIGVYGATSCACPPISCGCPTPPPPPKPQGLTDAQLHAVMGIITNFLLSDDAGTPPPADTTPPTFSSSSTVTVAENQTSAIIVVASDAGGSVTYAISGGDSAYFSINPTTGVITFKTAPDFESRNTYSFTVTATDSAGNTSSQTVVIHISDVPEGMLKKTGQTKSYDENGTEVTDGSIKDDGYYQTGVTPNYTRDDATNIVTDHITGLMWQDDSDAKTVTKPWLTQTNYDICTGSNGQTQDTSKCTDTSGDTATTYCTNLTLGGYTDWRLPTVDELMSIIVRGKSYPPIDTIYFKNITSSYYYASDNRQDLFAGHVLFDDPHHYYVFNKSQSAFVRCVRAGQ